MNHNKQRTNPWIKVANIKYLEMTVTNQNYNHYKIMS